MDKKPDNNGNRFQLDRVAFYGRTLSEYLKMFRIDDTDHLKRYNGILDSLQALPPSSQRLTTNMKSIQLVVIPYLTRIQEYCRNKVKKTLNMLLKEYHLLLIFTI